MKKFFCAISMIALLAISCNEKMVEPDKNDNYVQVKLGFKGEAPNITTTPMLKSGNAKDWYQIQVYYSPIGQTRYSYYGYGFFDNTNNMIINLKEGYQYKFVADMIVDGSEKINYFSLVNSGWASIGNSFIFSTDEHIRYLGVGYLYMRRPSDTYNRPDVDRFYGITEGYLPKEGGSVSIDMKRVSFGAKFVAKEFTSGSLEIQIDQSPTKKLNSTEGYELESIVSFNTTSAAYSNDDYFENIAVNVIWVKEDGIRTPIVSQDVIFVRNHLTTIEFEVKESAQSNSFNITAEEDWKSGETIFANQNGTNTEIMPQ